jgi:pimeloyl-ACP methyl ester carboxylesterase
MAKCESIYPTPEIAMNMTAMYDQKLSQWPVTVEQTDIPTRYGLTHLNICGSKHAPPVILIHAMGVASTMWQPNVAALSDKYRVYAIDTIGDLGKSVLDQFDNYPKNGKAYSEWLLDIFAQLKIDKADVIGASMGGWIAMNLAIHAPDKVRRLALLGPMGLGYNFEVFYRLFSVLWRPTTANQRSLIQWTIGENQKAQDAFGEYMFMATKCRGRLAVPLKLSGRQLKRILAPTLLCLGNNDHPVGNPAPVAGRAKRFIPQLEVEIIPDTGHMMNVEEPELVNMRLIRFLEGSK